MPGPKEKVGDYLRHDVANFVLYSDYPSTEKLRDSAERLDMYNTDVVSPEYYKKMWDEIKESFETNKGEAKVEWIMEDSNLLKSGTDFILRKYREAEKKGTGTWAALKSGKIVDYLIEGKIIKWTPPPSRVAKAKAKAVKAIKAMRIKGGIRKRTKRKRTKRIKRRTKRRSKQRRKQRRKQSRRRRRR